MDITYPVMKGDKAQAELQWAALCAYTTLRVQSDPIYFLSFHWKPICVDTASMGTANTTVSINPQGKYPSVL